ncbi:aminoglycoside 6'-N-acetyltransferase [Xanthocytophaga agilis]|uniref:Aminoglycoside N(6')-acetyltransferase type 1 n=1 Tax=Xanthocytophaga agilis TaxID=3048010 RepID=A0AAE3UHB6_9BACT|nr:aminoglycoside 6'-N-acetyltransferase [Xanthocytophaga agilis]MDJ1503282.1 GNAT family N-acetyltransferase [Xanthocytophaga agilis]
MNRSTQSIITASEQHLDELTQMGLDLWPDNEYEELKHDFLELLQTPENHVIYLFSHQGENVAFLHLSIRTDYVEGSDSTPTGYVEGIYVKPAFRRMRISQALFQHGEKWLKDKGCHQVGSDIYIDNQASYDFHTNMGFKESARLIAFIKDIP